MEYYKINRRIYNSSYVLLNIFELYVENLYKVYR